MQKIVNFEFKIRSGNDSLQEAPAHEIARMLREAADMMEAIHLAEPDAPVSFAIRDENGNSVGGARFDIQPTFA